MSSRCQLSPARRRQWPICSVCPSAWTQREPIASRQRSSHHSLAGRGRQRRPPRPAIPPGCTRSTGSHGEVAPADWTKSPNSGGIEPVNSLPLSDSATRLDRAPNSGGIEPVNPLPERNSCIRLDKPAQLRRYRTRQLVAGEIQHESGWTARPTQAVSNPSTRCWRDLAKSGLDKSPNSGDIEPVNPLLERSRYCNRFGQPAQLRRYRTRQLVVGEI